MARLQLFERPLPVVGAGRRHRRPVLVGSRVSGRLSLQRARAMSAQAITCRTISQMLCAPAIGRAAARSAVTPSRTSASAGPCHIGPVNVRSRCFESCLGPRHKPFAPGTRLSVHHYAQPEVRAAHALQDALRHHRRHRVAGARDRRERGDLLALQPDAAAAAAGPEPAGWSTWRRPGRSPAPTPATSGDCDEVFSYPMFRDLERAQTSSPASPRTSRSAPTCRPAARRMNGDGMLVSGSYFPVLGLQPALGRLLGPEDDRAPANRRRRPEPRLLADALRRRSERPQPDAHRQRPDDDDRRRRAAGLRRHDARRQAEGLRADHDARVHAARLQTASTNRRSYWAYLFARLKPGVSIEQARAALNDAVSRDPQRRRGAAAEGHERADAGAVQGEADRC